MDIFSIYKTFYTENKRWFFIVTILLLVAVACGGIAFQEYPVLLAKILDSFKNAIGDTYGWKLVGVIFLRNTVVAGIAAIVGILVGLPSLLILSFNGFILGYVTMAVVVSTKHSVIYNIGIAAAALLPHGIIELTAIIIAVAIGLRLGLYPAYIKLKSGTGFWATLKGSWKNVAIAAPLIIILLAIAAVVEVFVTGYLVTHLS